MAINYNICNKFYSFYHQVCFKKMCTSLKYFYFLMHFIEFVYRSYSMKKALMSVCMPIIIIMCYVVRQQFYFCS